MSDTLWQSILAIENFDYHLGWDLHVDCCQIAHDLRLDKLDSENSEDRPEGFEDEAKKNVLRRKMWQLIHMEFFFRLYYDKPPTITGSDFSVELPSLMTAPESANQSDTVYFLVNSKNVFITKEFFDVIQKPDENLKQRVEDLSAQIETTMTELNLVCQIVHSISVLT